MKLINHSFFFVCSLVKSMWQIHWAQSLFYSNARLGFSTDILLICQKKLLSNTVFNKEINTNIFMGALTTERIMASLKMSVVHRKNQGNRVPGRLSLWVRACVALHTITSDNHKQAVFYYRRCYRSATPPPFSSALYEYNGERKGASEHYRVALKADPAQPQN